MASRWFVFWIACFVIAFVKGDIPFALLFLLIASMTTVPESDEGE